MTIADCAALVQKGDPDRFLAAMAAPVWARETLFPLMAFNLEVARAPWVASEPLIAEMRLQWWQDTVEAETPRAHEVAGPLHQVIRDAGLPRAVLGALIAARRADAWGEPFADAAALETYLEATGAGLMWLCARALGAPERAEAAVRGYGWAAGLANYLCAVPELVARGRSPLPDASEAGVAALARQGLDRLAAARAARASLPRAAAPALLQGWQTAAILTAAATRPADVAAGGLRPSEFARRGGLLWQAATGRW